MSEISSPELRRRRQRCPNPAGCTQLSCFNLSNCSSFINGCRGRSRAATSEVSVSQTGPFKGTIELFACPPVQIPTQLSPTDREARVLRYREKKKNRKFEKTIRYASRKAYAETRPRIKGRFAKRGDVEAQVVSEKAYSVVASF
ncbi:Zinc finger protein CONSTANS-LIKE 2 [Sesamum alatum]|uniref:Zinc finger protein CONSTANS-LIKE 2 n=1 Tax=Sesamum alatum TaxID=300844 RepID=A0AAE2CLG7_9LAMI|nr:Zinc finger protein CONSTANS-LIKE 2 [Sesamum alatum]